MKVTQDGTDLNVEAYGELFNGNVIDHPRSSSKGEAALIACNTDPTDNASFGEIGRAKVWARDGGRGRLIIESLWNAQEAEICTCKGNFRRMTATDPEVGDCSGANAVDRWHDNMVATGTPGVGCYELDYPHRDWRKVDCVEGPTDPIGTTHAVGSKRGARTVGDGTDYAVSVPEGHNLFRVSGYFEGAGSVTSITDSVTNTINTYGLQINSNANGTPPLCETALAAPGCRGWQQGVYMANGTSPGLLVIQYWLIDYNLDGKTCPTGWWTASRPPAESHHCFVNAHKATFRTKTVPPVLIQDFSTMRLTMHAVHDGTDRVVLRIDGSGGSTLHATTQTSPDGMENLAHWWTRAEFNVFGHSGGSEAQFNADSSFDVKVKVDDYSGAKVSCIGTDVGTTGETNSLDLASQGCIPTSSGARRPVFTFNQHNM